MDAGTLILYILPGASTYASSGLNIEPKCGAVERFIQFISMAGILKTLLVPLLSLQYISVSNERRVKMGCNKCRQVKSFLKIAL